MQNLSTRDYSILIGSAVDHFDTALYAFLAPIFAEVFFPNSDPIISLILAYSVFASTIITRPLGSYFFGIIAMSYGPAVSLSYSLLGVGISTCAIGIMPTYEEIGFYAPLCLIVIRFLGGIFSAGEITIAKLYIFSDKNNKAKFKTAYLYQTSVMLGIILASFASTIVLKYQYHSYWRVCFIIGGIAALFGYSLRKYRKETLSLNIKQILYLYSFGSLKTLWLNKNLLLKIIITSGFGYLTYSLPFIIMNNLVPEFTNLTLEDMMPSNTILLVLDMILVLIIGSMLFRFKIQNILSFATCILAISIIPIWIHIEDSSFTYIIFIKIWIITIGVIFSNSINLWYDGLISEENGKYFIIGIGSAIGSAIIGKMAPAICLLLYHYTKSSLSIALFVLFISVLTFFAVISENQ